MNTISERVSYLLENKGLTPYAFCKETGFSEGTLSRILKKNQRPNESNIKVLLEFFRVSRAWLISGIGSEVATNIKDDVPVWSDKDDEIARLKAQIDDAMRSIALLTETNRNLSRIISMTGGSIDKPFNDNQRGKGKG